MEHIIEITPDEKGEAKIKLYGTEYTIKVVTETPKKKEQVK